MAQNTELLPCPFCGGEAKLKTFTSRGWLYKVTTHYVRCEACHCQTQVQFTAEEAVDIWNNRAAYRDKVREIFAEVKGLFDLRDDGVVRGSSVQDCFEEIRKKHMGGHHEAD
jgi:Lar family restriction alleviation protein